MKSSFNLEMSLQRIEQIIDILDTGVESFEEIVALYEEGAKLLTVCHERLEKIETRIEIVSDKLTKRKRTKGYEA